MMYIWKYSVSICPQRKGEEISHQNPTVNIFIEEEVEELTKSILVLMKENVGNAGVHFLYKPQLQLFCTALIL